MENMNLVSINKSEMQDTEGTTESFAAVFENKDKKIKVIVKQPMEFSGLSIGSVYDIKFTNPQKRLEA